MAELLTTGQAAREAGVTPATVRRWCERGLWHERTRGRHRRIAPMFLQLFLTQRAELVHRTSVQTPGKTTAVD